MRTPFNAITAVQAGFVKLADANLLYVHVRYPGFLFRLIESEAEAENCGAIYIENTDYSCMHFGFDLIAAARVDRLGEWGKPTSVSHAPVPHGLKPSFDVYESGRKWRHSVVSSVISEKSADWTANSLDYQFMGVISKADRGFILDFGKRPKADGRVPLGYSAQIPLTYPQGVKPFSADDGGSNQTNSMYDGGPTPLGLATTIVFAQNRGITFRPAMVSGFITNNVAVKAKQFILTAKPGFLAGMDADSKVVSAYSQALDAIASGYPEGALIADEFTVYPTLAPGADIVLFTTERREYGFGSGNNGGRGDPLRMRKYSAVDWPTVGGIPPSSVTPSDAQLNSVGYIISLKHEISDEGMARPFFIMMDLPTADGFPRVNPVDAVGTDWLAAQAGYPLDQVPYDKVELYQLDPIPAGSCYSTFGPRVGPLPQAEGSAPRVLKLNTKVERELGLILDSEYRPKPVEGSNPTEQAASVAAVEVALDVKYESYKDLVPNLTGFTRFIVNLVNEMDKTARTILKG